MKEPGLQELIDLLNLAKKRDIERYCRGLVIRSEDFANLILAGMAGFLEPYRHIRQHREFVPEDLTPTEDDREAFARNGVGPASDGAKKFIRKIDQTFKTRRLLSVHLFYTPCHTHWRLFYFDQRDYTMRGNHWEHGPHIHYAHDCFTQDPLQTVWQEVCAETPKLPKALHIRYDYHHNREKARPPGSGGWLTKPEAPTQPS